MLQKIKAGIKYIGAVIVAGGVEIVALLPSDTIIVHPDRSNIQSLEIYSSKAIVRDFRVMDTDGGSKIFDTRFVISPLENLLSLDENSHINIFLESGIIARVELDGVKTATTSSQMIQFENILSEIVLQLNK